MRALLYITVMLVITACSFSKAPSPELDEAQRLMSSDPTAALAKLNQLDVSELKDSSIIARWALLYSEAMVVNDLSAPTDTIVNIAIDYYGRHNLADEFEKASQLKALMRSAGNSDKLATALYLQKEREFLLYKERMKQQQIVFTGIIILLLAAGVIVWQRHRLKIKEMQNESLVAESSQLMKGLLQNESLCFELQGKIKNILTNRFSIIDELCETYFESHGTKTERKAIADKVKSQIDDLKSDSGLFAEMEKSVNDANNGILDNLKKEYPGVKPEEYRLIVYLAGNLSNRTIALLLGESIDVIYKRKSRLKAKIAALPSADSAYFLSIF